MSETDLWIVYAYAYAPAIVLLLFFWWMDRFEREPLALVLAGFLWGGFGAGILSEIWNTFLHLALNAYGGADEANQSLSAVLIAPMVEEFTKGLFILTVARLDLVDNLTDGILMGLAAGLGFAAAENVFYARQTWEASGEIAMWFNLWFRELHTTFLHAGAAAIFGGVVGISRLFPASFRKLMVFNGWILAVVVHSTWNFLAGVIDRSHLGGNIPLFLMQAELVVMCGALLAFFLFSVFRESRIILNELGDEVRKGSLPESHLAYLTSPLRRKRDIVWKNPKTLSSYVKTAVRLAFVRNEYRYFQDQERLNKIHTLREKLKNLNETATKI